MATLAQRLQAEIDRANETTSKADTTVHNAIGSLIDGYGQGGIEQVTWHQCPETVRNYLDEADYSSDSSYTASIIGNYATGIDYAKNSKPIAETVSGDSHRNEVPHVLTPFSSSTKSGTLKPLDALRWINTTSITWVDYNDSISMGEQNVNSFKATNKTSAEADEMVRAYINAHPETPNRKLFRVYSILESEHIPNNRKFMIYEDGELKLFSFYDVGYNVRDLGGWSCDGGTIKYGMLVRGGDTNPDDAHLMVDEIGIKTEVRLFETSAQGLDHSVWDIDMILNPTNSVIASSMDKAMWKPLLKGIFHSVAHNRPVYFHCGQGADRTGAMAVMLEAILGVSENDVSKDYELTSFSGALRERNGTGFKTVINNIKSVPLIGGLTDTFRNHAISFALSLGIKIGEINAFRKACINGNPEQISVEFTPYSITKRGDTANVVYSNPASEVEPYQEYGTTLSVPYGMTITGVTVTMGGSDITDSAFTGTETVPTVIKYAVRKTLSEATMNNQKTEVIAKEGYGAIVTPNENNHITGITVTVGGIDVSSSVVTLI